MSGLFLIKRFLTSPTTASPTGYGSLFLDTDNKLKLMLDNGTVFVYGLNAYEMSVQNGFVGTEADFFNSLHGLSAYEVWLGLGNTGTEADFILSLKGSNGLNGAAGLSAYEIWLGLGNTGTESDFILSLKGLTGNTGSTGATGLSAYEIWLNAGNTGTVTDYLNSLKGLTGSTGATGSAGLSAYQVWLNAGNIGTEQDFLDSLVGAQGNMGLPGIPGEAGQTGLSAYQIWLNNGNTGTIQDFLDSLVGATGNTGSTGQTGLSAYQVWLNAGNTGTETDFLNSLKGTNGTGLPTGGSAGSVPFKNSNADFDIVYKDFNSEVTKAVGSVTGDISGFENTTDSIISFDESTRTITVAPATTFYNVWLHGIKYTINQSISYQITDVDGGNYYNINPLNNTIYNAGATGGIRDNLLCVYVHWDSVNNKAIIFGDERHSYKRDTEWHYNQHRNFGTFWRSGGALGFTLNSESALNLSIGTPLVIADEDLEHIINHNITPTSNYEQILDVNASIPVMYYLNTGYVQTIASTNPWLSNTSAYYNDITNGIGSLVEAISNSYISYWLIATNDTKYPIKLLLGRTYHAKFEDALTETFESYGLPLPEVVSLYQIVIHTSTSYTNSKHLVIHNVRKISDRVSSSGAASSATSHDSLTGRSNLDSHPISAITGLQSVIDAIHSIPNGGTTNQVLKKINNTDYAVSWQDESGAILIHEADTPPVDTAKYPLWLDTTTARLKIFYTSSNVYIDVLPSIKGDTGATGATGSAGLSAYQIWLNAGNTGTVTDYLNSLKGATGNNGSNGSNGLSAYDIWLNNGHIGTESQFLASLIGATGSTGSTGSNGLSAYEVWVNAGNNGTVTDYLNSLKGATGNTGSTGATGLSAYEIWINAGNNGTVTDYLNSLKGATGNTGSTGADGLSAYQVWLNAGNSGTVTDYLNSLIGATGPQGPAGVVPSNLDIQSILLANNTGALTSTANKAFITAIDIANTVTPAIVESNGVLELIQGSLLVKNFNYLTAIANGTTFSALGLAAPTVIGTATAATLATTNNYTKTPRVEALVTTAATTAVAGYRGAVASFILSADTTQRGFKFSMDGAPATGLATASNRFFMGLMSSTAAPTDVDPSTITNILGIGYSNADTTLQFMYRGAGAVVKLNTGIAKPTADRTALYRLIIVSNDGVTSISIIDLISGTHYQATLLNASLPLNTLLTYKIYSSAGGTSSVTGIAISRLYYEYINVNIA